VTKQHTTAIISKLTFRVTQIRILSHFSSCHALFATPNLDASAVLLLRLSSTPENKKEFKEKQKNSAGILFFATMQLRMPFSSSSSSSSTPPPEEAQKQTNQTKTTDLLPSLQP
jgi:hypothetical protein